MITREELLTLDKVFIQRQEGYSWNSSGLMDYLDCTWVSVEELLITDQGVLIERDYDNDMCWSINYDCLFEQDPRDKKKQIRDTYFGKGSVCESDKLEGAMSPPKEYEVTTTTDESLNKMCDPDVQAEIIAMMEKCLEETKAVHASLDEEEEGVFLITREDIQDHLKAEETTGNDWTDQHYDFTYKHPVSESDAILGYVNIKLDPYMVAKEWDLGGKDASGILFHITKTCARFGTKNTKAREVKALYAQVLRLAELNGVEL